MAAAVLTGVLTLAACGSGETPETPVTPGTDETDETADPYGTAATALCDAAGHARAADADAADTVFYDLVHQPLHDLAVEAAESDRAVAASLLEAKEAVESSLGDADPASVSDDFEQLVAATDQALATTSHPGVPCATTSRYSRGAQGT
jgi:hypothetical protein